MKTAIVTGAAQGLGLVTADWLARLGFHVVLTDRQPLDEPLARLRAAGLQVHGFCGDVASPEFVAELGSRIEAEFHGAQVLVNNAGVSLIAPAEQTTDEQWRRVLEVNLFAPFLLCRQIGAQMLQRRSGSIVNVASVAGLSGISHRCAYNASKHGLIGLTRTLAAEWGGRGVRVNAVCPGWIKTEMDVTDQGSGAYSDQDIVNRVPQARFARPEEVAAAIGYLADERHSGYVNGVALPVDGGWTSDGGWESLRLRVRAAD